MIKKILKVSRRRRILRDIKRAKKCFEEGIFDFMCHSFMTVSDKYCMNPIDSIIPEFNRDFLNAKYKEGRAWWDYLDRESRIKAFDRLIEVYSKK